MASLAKRRRARLRQAERAAQDRLIVEAHIRNTYRRRPSVMATLDRAGL